mgnify:CR=1 FL=1
MNRFFRRPGGRRKNPRSGKVQRQKRQYAMKTGKIFRALATGMVIVCLAAGCAKSGAESSDRKAILFSVPATRSAVTSLGEGDAFAVWARQSSAGAAQMILRQETVRCAAGVWSYDNLRYWQQGATYDFYALYPHDVPQAVLADTDAGQTRKLFGQPLECGGERAH